MYSVLYLIKHVKSNFQLVQTVKPHIKQLVEDANLLKMWISFLIPKIEDGNNFGVSVQEDTLAEIQSVESEAAAFFDQITRYYASRAKVISKVSVYLLVLGRYQILPVPRQ